MRFRLVLPLLLASMSFVFAQTNKSQHIVSGIVLTLDQIPLDPKSLLATLKNDWKIKSDSLSMADKTIVFSTPGATVMIAQLLYPADPIELRAAAQLSWLWPTAATEATKSQAQVVISVIGAPEKAVELYQTFTKVAAAVLESTRSSGVYMSGQYLLLSKGYYSAAAHNMLDNQTLPVYCWVYFGRPGDGGGYTFGMQEFGFPEMEIAGSKHNNAEVHATLYEAASSTLKYNTRPDKNNMLFTEEGSKIGVKMADGVFLEGQRVLQLQF